MFLKILATSLILIMLPACLFEERIALTTEDAPVHQESDCCWCKRLTGESELTPYQSRLACEMKGGTATYASCQRIQVRNNTCVFPNGVPDDSAPTCKCESLASDQCQLVKVFVSGKRQELGSAFRAPDTRCTLSLCKQLFSVTYDSECQ